MGPPTMNSLRAYFRPPALVALTRSGELANAFLKEGQPCRSVPTAMSTRCRVESAEMKEAELLLLMRSIPKTIGSTQRVGTWGGRKRCQIRRLFETVTLPWVVQMVEVKA